MNVLSHIFFGAVALIALLFALREWRIFTSLSDKSNLAVARKRLHRRIAGLMLLLIVSIMLMLYQQLREVLDTPAKGIAYLGVCLIAMVVLFWLVVVDVREMGRAALQDQQNLVLQSLESLRRYMKEQKPRRQGELTTDENKTDS
jgi:hypothetical protein